jgi:ribonuclease Z
MAPFREMSAGGKVMSTREVVFLGTASQVPTRSRNHNALFLFWDDLGILFDPGEGTQRQMTFAGLSVSQITHICITHFHGDHCLGLAGIVQRLSLDRVPHSVEIVYPRSGQVYFERLRHASIFYDAAKIVPRPIEVAPNGEMVARYGKFALLAQPLDHGVDCYGYRLQEEDGVRMIPEELERAGVRGPLIRQLLTEGKVQVAGRTVALEEVSERKPGQAVAVVMDTRPCAGAEALARGVDLLVCEATYLGTEATEAHDHFHMTAAQAAELARSAGARWLALTHFSQRYTSLEGFAAEASAIHPDVVVAEDMTRVRVPPRSV